MKKIKKQNKMNLEKKFSDKRIIYLMLLFVLLVGLCIGGIAAYFSDIKFSTGEIDTSDLRIEANYEFYVNGTEKSLSTITALNPGDVIIVKATVLNKGKSSAWIRETLELDLEDELHLNYFEVYEGQYTYEDFILGEVSSSLLTNNGNKSLGRNRVIDGIVDIADEGLGYEYIGDISYVEYYTIYFLPTATNEMQNRRIGFKVSTQALQFKNNNLEEPSEAAWATVAVAS